MKALSRSMPGVKKLKGEEDSEWNKKKGESSRRENWDITEGREMATTRGQR